MTVSLDTLSGPIKHTFMVEKYHGDAETGELFETSTATVWFEADGTQVTDPTRIAELEEGLLHGTNEHGA